jgi:hypothetical protein
MFIGCDFTVGVQSTFESELFSTEACGKNRIFDMNNVLRAYACVGVFYIFQKISEKFYFDERLDTFHSCYGVKGRYFILLQMGMGGGELLWRNLLPKSS